MEILEAFDLTGSYRDRRLRDDRPHRAPRRRPQPQRHQLPPHRPRHLPASRRPPADFDQIEAAARREDATICLTSALAQHELIDTIPASLHIAIQSRSRIPATEGAITWHQFDRATFELGRELIPIAGTDLTIGRYTAERLPRAKGPLFAAMEALA